MQWLAGPALHTRSSQCSQALLAAPQVHGNYVDCVRWLGDLLLSKSVEGAIVLTR